MAYRDFQYLWTYGLVQGVARNMAQTLAYLLVFHISGSAVQLGLTGFFQLLPTLVFGLVGGALADSMDRKKLIAFTQLLSVLSGLLLIYLVYADLVRVWHLWLFMSFWSAVNIMGRPAQRSYLPRLVPTSQVLNGVTWYGSLGQGTQFAGPMLAGALAEWSGFGTSYVINTALQVAALLAVFPIRAPGRPEMAQRKAMLHTILEGLNYVRMQEVLKAAMVIDFGVMSVGYLRPLLPVLALDVFHVGDFGVGVMSGATAVGAILATLLLLVVGDFKRKGAAMVVAYAMYAGAIAIIGITPWYSLALLAFAVTGFSDGLAFTLKQSLIQIIAPDQYRGRSVAASSILSQTGNATGSVEMGLVAGIAGAPGALIINGGIALGMTALVTLKWMGLWHSEA